MLVLLRVSIWCWQTPVCLLFAHCSPGDELTRAFCSFAFVTETEARAEKASKTRSGVSLSLRHHPPHSPKCSVVETLQLFQRKAEGPQRSVTVR